MVNEKRSSDSLEFSLDSYNEDENSIEGYAIKWGMESSYLYKKELGRFKEVFKKGAFKDSISSGKDIFFLAHHKMDNILGRTYNNTLELIEDDIGLKIKVKLPKTTDGKDIFSLIKDRYLTGLSISFYNPVETIEEYYNRYNDEKFTKRIIEKADLVEISIVTNPAYKSTEVNVRNSDLISIDEYYELKYVQNILDDINEIKELLK